MVMFKCPSCSAKSPESVMVTLFSSSPLFQSPREQETKSTDAMATALMNIQNVGFFIVIVI